MNTTSNGATTMRRTIFNYTRPSFTGFDLAEQPSAEVARTIKKLVELLSAGFTDKNRGGDQELKELRAKLMELEDDDANGINDLENALKAAMIEVTDASMAVNNASGDAAAAADAWEKAKGILEELIRKHAVPADEKPDSTTTEKKTKSAPDTIAKTEHSDIITARQELGRMEEEKMKLEDWVTVMENEKFMKVEAAELARLDLESKREEVQNNVEETLRYIEAAKEKTSDNGVYKVLLSIAYLKEHKEDAGKIKFKNKIGSHPQLNGLFILVEDQVQKNKLSYNAALFLRNPVIMEFIFLRAYLIDGLRDATALYERLIDEQEGGIKYIYDYVVARVVTKIIKAKKLKNGK